MRTARLALAFAACIVATPGSAGAAPDPIVSHFHVQGVSAVRALLQLSRSEHLPIGIVQDDDTLCRSVVNYSIENVPASVVIEGINRSGAWLCMEAIRPTGCLSSWPTIAAVGHEAIP